MSGIRWRPAWGWWGALLGAGAVLLATQLKILTYSTGQDPFTYTRLAMGLLERGMSLEALGSVAGFIIPGWPIVLAMVIKLLGPFAVSWVGFVFMWGALAGLLLLARKRGLSPWGGLLLAWALLWLVWNGEGLYAHFLLYAFRGAPQFFCMVWAFVLLEAAHPAQRSGAFVPGLATCVLLAGALIRETTLIALPGMLAWVALSPAWKNQRWRGMAGLLAPVALLLAAGLVYALASGWGGNQQVKSWWMFLAQLDGTVYVDRLQEYFRLMGAAAGGSGLILFALGIWIQRRQGRWLILWCLPALGLAAFYAVFMVHQRYVLDSYLLLAVVAAAGVAFAVEEAARRTGPKFRAWILGGGLALLLGLNLQATQHLPVWGQRISRAEVKNFVRITRRQVPDGSRLWTDWNCRHLVEVGWTYLDARPLAGGEDFPGRRAAGTGYYWGLSDPGPFPGIRGADTIKRHADLLPVEDGPGLPVSASLGTTGYRLQRIVSWERRRVELAWRPDPGGPSLLWLDFQESDPDAERQVRLLAADGSEIHRWTVPGGNGLIPFYVEPANMREGDAYRVEVESTGLLPSEIVHRPELQDGVATFTMVQGRLPSAMKWIRPPVQISFPQEKWGAVFTDVAGFDLPLPQGMVAGEWRCAVTLEPRFRSQAAVVFHYEVDGAPVASFTNRLDRPRLVHEIPVAAPFSSPRARLGVRCEVPDGFANHFRLVSLGFRISP